LFSTRNQAHASGVKVMAWCRSPEAMIQAGHADEEQLFPSLLDTGADVICTNFPAKLCAFLAAKKEAVGEAKLAPGCSQPPSCATSHACAAELLDFTQLGIILKRVCYADAAGNRFRLGGAMHGAR
jgi:hypothetical protein